MARSPRKNAKKRAQGAVKLQRHQIQCTVCKHPNRNEIERSYCRGTSAYEIEDKFGVSPDAVYRHVAAYKLDKRPDLSTLRACRLILRRACLSKRKITDRLLITALTLEAKLTGELVERHEHSGKFEHTHSVSELVQKQMDSLIEALGGLSPEVQARFAAKTQAISETVTGDTGEAM